MVSCAHLDRQQIKSQVIGPFSRFVRTLIIKIPSSEEPANSMSIHRIRNGGKLVILFHPSPKNLTERRMRNKMPLCWN